jgi:hypothetical protein
VAAPVARPCGCARGPAVWLRPVARPVAASRVRARLRPCCPVRGSAPWPGRVAAPRGPARGCVPRPRAVAALLPGSAAAQFPNAHHIDMGKRSDADLTCGGHVRAVNRHHRGPNRHSDTRKRSIWDRRAGSAFPDARLVSIRQFQSAPVPGSGTGRPPRNPGAAPGSGAGEWRRPSGRRALVARAEIGPQGAAPRPRSGAADADLASFSGAAPEHPTWPRSL